MVLPLSPQNFGASSNGCGGKVQSSTESPEHRIRTYRIVFQSYIFTMSTRFTRSCLTNLGDPLRISCNRSQKVDLIPSVVARQFSTQTQRKTKLCAASVAAPLVVKVEWGDGMRVLLHSDWLRDNCKSVRHPETTQKLSSAADDVPGVVLVDAKSPSSIDHDHLVVKWSDNRESSFDSSWLRSQFPQASTPLVQQRKSQLTSPSSSYSEDGFVVASTNSSNKKDAFSQALRACDPVPTCKFDDIIDSEEGTHEWVSKLMDTGICVVNHAPKKPDYVAKLASRMAPPMRTLYDETFDVRVEKNPINIAYTNTELTPHMDLPYYESPPGIQFLHCIEFDPDIVGGESVFFDTFVLAELLRERDPEAFDVLCKVPATFQKDHLERSKPAQFIYRRPHISLNHLGEVIAVYWSPAFEGPLVLDGSLTNPENVAAYYRAYRAFANLMTDAEVRSKWMISFKLKPGEVVTFNQRRLLHGRNSFLVPESKESSGRWFQGCYISMDDYLNRFRTLRLKFHGDKINSNSNSSNASTSSTSTTTAGVTSNVKSGAASISPYLNKHLPRGIESAIRVGNGCFH
jgi:alpha-ketoglutarate-dependent taurine dioxygenase